MSEGDTTCPICKLQDQEIVAETDYGDKVTYNCARCGRFTISRSAEAVADNSPSSARLSGWLRERTILGIEIPMLTTTFIEEVFRTLPHYKPIEKQQKLLRALSELSDYPGDEIVILPDHFYSLAYAENETEFNFYVKSLLERGLVSYTAPGNREIGAPLYGLTISSEGWDYLDSISEKLENSSQAFVAMSFDSSLRPVYENAIAPAIESTGYRPYRVDVEPHLERIDIKIIAEIRQSRFLVADVTQQKPGVYYEAGFAHGLDIPVIWCVREDDLDNVHFDTRQYNHVLWKEEQDLRTQLENYILATIGALSN